MLSTPALFQGNARRWRIAPPTPAADAALVGNGLPPLAAHLLARRGIVTEPSATDFMGVSERLFEDPAALPHIDEAISRLRLARERGETVAVYGDFDADGVTGTALAVKALTRFGVRAISYIPHRVSEGHGLNNAAVDTLRERGAELIITVDCGVTDVGPVAYARNHGVDTIITDHHHVPDGDLPPAVAVINPRAPHSAYGFDHLTGVGMTLKVAQALLAPEHPTDWADGLLELAAIGTITDMAPLQGENRYIVHHGLAQLRTTRSVGLRALLAAGRVEPAHATAETIGFTIGPRINAAGRLDHADTALALLVTDSPEQAAGLVSELDALNSERQRLTEQTLEAARALVPVVLPPLLAVGDPAFNPGVVGLVAGKLAEEFGVPAFVYTMEGGQVMASCRSTPGFHWAEALGSCEGMLTRFGGHAQAAGFACAPDALPLLTTRLQDIAAEQLGDAPPAPEGVVDAEVSLRELMGPTFSALRRMEPHGVGNPSPVFLSRGLAVEQARTMGADGAHFRLNLRADGARWEAVAFRQRWELGTEAVDLVYTIGVDHWNGQERLRLTVLDYAPAPLPPVTR